MQRLRIVSTVVGLLLMILVSACAPSTPSDPVFEKFDPNNFDNSTNIDNKWFPLKPGTQLVFEGNTTTDAGEQVSHRVIITVTDLTKVIGGVRSVVTWDLDYSADQLVEAELAFFAQDNDGNIWRMGEYPEEYVDGKFDVAPTWLHGLDDALAGIAMQADPQLNTPDYPQGWGPAVDWTDRGKVDQMGQQTCVPFNCFEDVLVIAETSATEQGAFQLKYFAPELGNIRVDWRGTDQTQETLELVEYNQLSSEEMDEVRAEAFEMEKHAYEVSPDVYGQTPPLE